MSTAKSDLESWPGDERRRPRMSSVTYAVRAPLAAWMREQALEVGRNGPVRILDVGCGPKPYYPFFASSASEYVGVDVGHPDADLQGRVEELPVDDASFDIVLCTQVLEHCDEPARAVRELRRVTAPGGRVLASTHGVHAYHPAPQDLWRWTHTGLERLFAENGEWSHLSVTPGAGTGSCLAMLLGTYVEIGFRRAGAPRVARPVVWALNRTGRALDRRSQLLRTPVQGALIANYHVVARVGD